MSPVPMTLSLCHWSPSAASTAWKDSSFAVPYGKGSPRVAVLTHGASGHTGEYFNALLNGPYRIYVELTFGHRLYHLVVQHKVVDVLVGIMTPGLR